MPACVCVTPITVLYQRTNQIVSSVNQSIKFIVIREALFAQLAEPEAHVFNPQPRPALPARIQDGNLMTNSVFFNHPTTCVQTN